MWTNDNRAAYDRSELRYPSDLTDAEWALIEPLIPAAKRGGNKRTVDVRAVMNGAMYILSTGCQWRALPKDLPARSHDCPVRCDLLKVKLLELDLAGSPDRSIRGFA